MFSLLLDNSVGMQVLQARSRGSFRFHFNAPGANPAAANDTSNLSLQDRCSRRALFCLSWLHLAPLISCTQAIENIFHIFKLVHTEMPRAEEAPKSHWLAWKDEGEAYGSVFTQQKQCSPGRCHSSPAFQRQERLDNIRSHSSLFAACQCLIILTSGRVRAD